MIQRSLAIFLICSTLSAVLLPFVPYLEYAINYNHIVEHLCINRHNPEVECNGACYLKKKIDKVHDHSEHNNATTPEKEGQTQNLLPILAIHQALQSVTNNLEKESKKFDFSDFIYNAPFADTLFRPPQA